MLRSAPPTPRRKLASWQQEMTKRLLLYELVDQTAWDPPMFVVWQYASICNFSATLQPLFRHTYADAYNQSIVIYHTKTNQVSIGLNDLKCPSNVVKTVPVSRRIPCLPMSQALQCKLDTTGSTRTCWLMASVVTQVPVVLTSAQNRGL